MIFRDTQEAIVDEDTWYVVQKIRETKHRPIAQGKANPLTGLMFCADCGAKMFNHRTKGYEKKDKDGNPTGKYTNAQNNYTCSTYSKAKGHFENKCSQHHVRTDVVRDLLLTTLHYTASYVKEHEDEFLEKVRKSNVLKQEASNVDKFIALVHKYTDFSELTTPMIHEFIDRIEVHEADKSTGERTQEIDIYLKYVGRLDVPMPELTAEELAENERKRRKRAWNRTYNRRKAEKERAEKEKAALEAATDTDKSKK